MLTSEKKGRICSMKRSFLLVLILAVLVLFASCRIEDEAPVEFHPNGGNSSRRYILLYKGDKVPEPRASKENCSLVGWYTNENFTGEAWDFQNDVVTGGMDLYAKWSPFFTINDGSISINPNSIERNEEVSIPNGMTRIAVEGFKDCTEIKSMSIPASVVSFGSRCFSGCTNLMKIEFAGSYDKWDSIVKGEDWNEGIPTGAKLICTDKEISL